MTATDELRLMLDESGVEWKAFKPNPWVDTTSWDIDLSDPRREVEAGYSEYEDGVTLMRFWNATPAQAIAATLGGGYQGFWTHDGTLHVELPKLPESISVRLPDKRDREVRSARVWQYTLDDVDATPTRQVDGTCHISVQDNLAETEGMGDVWLECDECHWQMPLEPSTPRFNYCPNCGKKVVE